MSGDICPSRVMFWLRTLSLLSAVKKYCNSTTVAIAKDEKHNFDADYNAPSSL